MRNGQVRSTTRIPTEGPFTQCAKAGGVARIDNYSCLPHCGWVFYPPAASIQFWFRNSTKGIEGLLSKVAGVTLVSKV